MIEQRYASLVFDLYTTSHRQYDFRELVAQSGFGKSLTYSMLFMIWGEDLIGMEFKIKNGWAVILREMSHADRYGYRLQRFDNRGFSMHECHKTLEDAARELATEFVWSDPGALTRVSSQTEWRLGSYAADLVMRVNQGDMTMIRANELYDVRKIELGLAA